MRPASSLKSNPRNFTSLKDRPLTSKEINSLSISKRSEKAHENPMSIIASMSHDKEPPFSDQRTLSNSAAIKQNLQMKALKSLIKNKYGSIPQNFISILKSLDKKDSYSSKDNPSQSKLLNIFYKSPPVPSKKTTQTPFHPTSEKQNKFRASDPKSNPMNKSCDSNLKPKFLDLEKHKTKIFSHRDEKNENLYYVSDIRGNGDFSEKHPKKNLMPDSDLEEILDKFRLMNKIENFQGFMNSMRFIMNEIKARSPKTAVFLEKVENCYEKLMGVLIEKNQELINENSVKTQEKNLKKMGETPEKNNKSENLKNLQNGIISTEKKIVASKNEEKEIQTEPEFYWVERMEMIKKEKMELEGQNQRLIMILKNLNKRGIDIEKLFEKQIDSLINSKISFTEIKKIKMDSEESFPLNNDDIESLQKDKHKQNFKKNKSDGHKTQIGLKLDLTKVNNLANGGQPSEKEEIVGFHQEFMSRLDEFSESWRDAAMNERR